MLYPHPFNAYRAVLDKIQVLANGIKRYKRNPTTY